MVAGHRVTYDGLVLETRERNGHDDSDFYAIVYDPEKKDLVEVEYASTRYPSYGSSARADADERVKNLARGVLYRDAFDALRLEDAARVAALRAEVRVGDEVRVARGRKVPKGTEGRVFWAGEVDATFAPVYRNGYNRPKSKLRLGLELKGGERVFVDAKNVDLVADGSPRKAEPMSRRELRERAWRFAANPGVWRKVSHTRALARSGWLLA